VIWLGAETLDRGSGRWRDGMCAPCVVAGERWPRSVRKGVPYRGVVAVASGRVSLAGLKRSRDHVLLFCTTSWSNRLKPSYLIGS